MNQIIVIKHGIINPLMKQENGEKQSQKNYMLQKKVWRTICTTDVPKDRRSIECKWVFKIKRDGTYRARLVALG